MLFGLKVPHRIGKKEEFEYEKDNKQFDQNDDPKGPPQSGHLPETVPIETVDSHQNITGSRHLFELFSLLGNKHTKIFRIKKIFIKLIRLKTGTGIHNKL